MSFLGIPAFNPFPVMAGVAFFALGLVSRFSAKVSLGIGVLAGIAVWLMEKYIAPRLSEVQAMRP